MPIKSVAVINGGNSRKICKQLEQILILSGLEKTLRITSAEIPHGDYSHRILALCGELESFEDVHDFDTVIYPYRMKKIAANGAITVSYDKENDKADFTAKNIRSIDGRIVFELLGTGIIGRLSVMDDCKTAVENAVLQACVMLSAGIPLKETLNAINKLKF